MKRSHRKKSLKQAVFAVPAAALMLGATHAGTVALNFNSFYYNTALNVWAPGDTPAPIGVGLGYQTSGWLVTATAFGVDPANWYAGLVFANRNLNPVDVIVPMGPTISAEVTSYACYETGIGELNAGFNASPAIAETINPGNDQVTWTELGSAVGQASPTVMLSGLAAAFPQGYAIQTIAAAPGAGKNFNGLQFTDGVNATHVDYTTTYTIVNTPGADITSGTVGLSSPSGTFTSDTLQIVGDPQTTGSNSCLSAFIITDVPVLTRNVTASLALAVGAPFILPTPSVVGVGLQYQWQLAGTNLPGATFATYTNNSAATTASGLYQAVVTSSFFPGQSVTAPVANVTVIPPHTARSATWDANTAVTGAQDGAGTWTFGGTNWWTGTVDGYWGAADTAIFGAGGTSSYLVTIGDSLSASALTFSSAGYTITNAPGKNLTLQGATTITANAAGTIASPLTVVTTNGLVKAGTGYLTLSGALTCPSNTVVKAGTLEVQSKAGGDAAYVVTNGATLKLGYTTGGGYANSGLTIYGAGAAATSGLYLKGGTRYNTSGTLTVNTAPTTIRQYGTGYASLGIFDIHSTGLYITAAASGTVTDPNVQMVNFGYGMVVSVDAGTNTANGDLIIQGPLNVPLTANNYGFYKKGLGSVRLNAPATTNNGSLQLTAGTAICGVDNCLGTNAVLNISGGATLDLRTTSQTVSNALIYGKILMTINKGAATNAIPLNCWWQGATVGGTLAVTNLGGPLTLGDSFLLFPTAVGGTWTNYALPVLANGLAWLDNTAVDGTIQVIPGSIPPSIVNDLGSVTNFVYPGGATTFSITASGDVTLKYQWSHNGAPVAGATNASLTLTSLTPAASGIYVCTVSNNFGIANSQNGYLTVLTPSGYDGIVAASGPMDYWPLNETAGLVAIDAVNTNNATYHLNYLLGVAGPLTNTLGVQFDSSAGTFALAPYSPALNPTVWTVEAWLNSSVALTGTTLTCALSCGQFASTGRSGWLIYQSATGWNLRTYIGVGTGTGANVTGATIPSVGSWQHVVATWDGTNANLYVNGVLDGTGGSTTTPKYQPGLSGGFCIGARADNSFAWNGVASEVAYYNRVLAPTEIQAHAANRPIITASNVGGAIVLTWPAGTGQLKSAASLTGPFTTVTGATSPYTNATTGVAKYYRIGQ